MRPGKKVKNIKDQCIYLGSAGIKVLMSYVCNLQRMRYDTKKSRGSSGKKRRQ